MEENIMIKEEIFIKNIIENLMILKWKRSNYKNTIQNNISEIINDKINKRNKIRNKKIKNKNKLWRN